MSSLSIYIDGIGAWAPGLADWPALADWLRGGAAPAADAPARPQVGLLPAAERRRAPLAVLIALDAASEAIAASGHDPATLPTLFTSSHGDTHIVDAMCATLAEAPAELSPTQFHNSVHNAAAGYWTIASRCHKASSAMAAFDASFAAGLFEAAVQVAAEAAPIMLVASDVAARGPLAGSISNTRAFACALVLAPQRGPRSQARLSIDCGVDAPTDAPLHAPAAQLAGANASARALGLLEAFATGTTRPIHMDAAQGLMLRLQLEEME